jgi:hypothetical protein
MGRNALRKIGIATAVRGRGGRLRDPESLDFTGLGWKVVVVVVVVLEQVHQALALAHAARLQAVHAGGIFGGKRRELEDGRALVCAACASARA